LSDISRLAGQSATPVSTAIVCAVLAAIAVALVVVDPYLSAFLPDGLWRHLHLEESPYKIAPLTLACAVAAAFVAWAVGRTGSLVAAGILVLLIASQTNGLRLAVIDPLDLALFTVLLIWMASRFGSAERSVMVANVVWASLALIILNLPNVLHENPVRFLAGSLSLTRCLLLSLLVLNFVSSSRHFDFAVRILMAVAIASAIIGIVQFCAGYFFGAYYTLIDPPETAFKPTPIGMVMRSSALCITAQHFSGFLTLALPFMLFSVTEPNSRSRVARAVGLTLVLLGIVSSWNFGAIFVAAAIVGSFPFFRWPRWSVQVAVTYVLAFGLAYFTGIIELAYDLTFGDSGVAKGVSQRKTLMELGFTKLYQDPWVGEGVFGMSEFSGNFWGRPVHNAYLQTMTEVGMLGGGVLIALLLVLATQLFLTGATAGGRMASHLRACLMSVLALMVLMMSEPMMDHSNTWLMLALAEAALLVALGRQPASVSMRDSSSAAAGKGQRRSALGTAQ
jgi:hypothetical protein